MKTADRIPDFKTFWPFYLGEHKKPLTRWMHFTGSTLGLLALFWGVYSHQSAFFLCALFIGYGFAWVSHFFIEKNRPATFTYPLWSFVADWKMWFGMLTGRLR